jgi:hypothetical protein
MGCGFSETHCRTYLYTFSMMMSILILKLQEFCYRYWIPLIVDSKKLNSPGLGFLILGVSLGMIFVYNYLKLNTENLKPFQGGIDGRISEKDQTGLQMRKLRE